MKQRSAQFSGLQSFTTGGGQQQGGGDMSLQNLVGAPARIQGLQQQIKRAMDDDTQQSGDLDGLVTTAEGAYTKYASGLNQYEALRAQYAQIQQTATQYQQLLATLPQAVAKVKGVVLSQVNSLKPNDPIPDIQALFDQTYPQFKQAIQKGSTPAGVNPAMGQAPAAMPNPLASTNKRTVQGQFDAGAFAPANGEPLFPQSSSDEPTTTNPAATNAADPEAAAAQASPVFLHQQQVEKAAAALLSGLQASVGQLVTTTMQSAQQIQQQGVALQKTMLQLKAQYQKAGHDLRQAMADARNRQQQIRTLNEGLKAELNNPWFEALSDRKATGR